MGPEHYSPPQTWRQEPWQARPRLCLLKGCDCLFVPCHPLSRYCSEECKTAARKWSEWKARRGYRASEKGKEQHRQESGRGRERQAQRTVEPPDQGDAGRGVGHHKSSETEGISCDRPGCYDCFPLTTRSPLKCFCSPLCRNALRRVRLRERRWLSPSCAGRSTRQKARAPM